MNYNQMTKKQLLERLNFKCKHGHNGIAHPNCYKTEKHIKEKIGFLDIETSNLKANFGIVYSYSIKVENSEKIYHRVITPQELKSKTMDKKVVSDCIKDMRKFDRIITHYGTKFDLPFLRTRAIIYNLKFPVYGELKHTDTYYLAKRLLCLHSNRQNIIAESLFGETIKTRLDNHHWVKGLQGNKKSLKYILNHNIADAIELERNYHKLVGYSKQTNRSL